MSYKSYMNNINNYIFILYKTNFVCYLLFVLPVQSLKDWNYDKHVCIIWSIPNNDSKDIDLHSMRGILTPIRVMNSIVSNTQTELVITFLGLRGIHLFGCSICRKKAAYINLCAHDAQHTYQEYVALLWYICY